MAPPSSSPEAPPGVRPRHRLAAILWALSGGLFAILAAFVKESGVGGGPLLVMLFAPAVEEVLKPSGIYYLLERRLHYLSSAQRGLRPHGNHQNIIRFQSHGIKRTSGQAAAILPRPIWRPAGYRPGAGVHFRWARECRCGIVSPAWAPTADTSR